MDLVFASSLPSSYRDALERLVFFNPNQLHMEGGITRAMDLYGSPEIASSPDGLSVTVSGCSDVQCLFAVDEASGRTPILAGMLVYLRTSREEMLVVHVAVGDPYSRTRRTGLGVVIRLIRALRASARRLRGVECIRFLYTDERQYQIRINAGPDRSENRSLTDAVPMRLVS